MFLYAWRGREKLQPKMQNFIKLAHEKIKKLVALEEENKNLKAKIENLETQLLKQRVKEVEEKGEEPTPKSKPNNSKIAEKKKSSLENWLHGFGNS